MDLVQNEKYIIHNITNADTLSGLSLLYNIDINIIKKVNNLSTGEIWGFSYLKIPKNGQNCQPKNIREDKEYYENSKRSDNLKLLKNLTNEDENVINTIYNHTNENFKKTLVVLEEISALQKKHNIDVQTVLAHYLVYSDTDGNVFKLIEEKIIEGKKKVKLKNRTSKNALQLQHLEEKNNKNINNDENIDFANINRVTHPLLEKSSQSLSYVKDIFKKILPILNSESKEDNEKCQVRKKKENSETTDFDLYTTLHYSTTKRKNNSDISEDKITENKKYTNEHDILIHKNSNGVLRRRI